VSLEVTICDVSPSDGLQNERVSLDPPVRAELVDRLAMCSVPRIEVADFPAPGGPGTLTGPLEVLASIHRRSATIYAAGILDEKGFDQALEGGVTEVRYVFPITEAFCARTQGITVGEAIARSKRITAMARRAGVRFSVTLAAAFGCPFGEKVETGRVLEVAGHVLLEEPPDELVLADTIGVGVPTQVRDRVRGVQALRVGVIGCHFHNTRNTGIANAVAAVENGATLLDASVGGTGECEFAPGASGNVATEDVVYTLHGMGIVTGIDLDRLIDTGRWLGGQLGKEMPSMVGRAGSFVAAG
jgi:isopropylmalate/homocitrate/citramalate synthase